MPSQVIIIGASIGASVAVVMVLLAYYWYRRKQVERGGPQSLNTTEPPSSAGTMESILCCCCHDEDDEEDPLLHHRHNVGGSEYGGSTRKMTTPPLVRKKSSFSAGKPTTYKRSTSPSGDDANRKTKKQRYKIKKKLGEGAYGVVYLAIRTEDLKQVAVKVVPCQDEKAAAEAMKEYEMMKASQGHENIVELYDVFFDEPREDQLHLFGAENSSGISNVDSNAPVILKELGIRTHGGKSYVCIVSAFCEAGTLFDLLLTKRSAGQRHQVCLAEHVVWSYTAQLLRGLDHMHTRNMMHRDLKPSNVLLSESFQKVTLTDFGLSRVVTADEYVQTRTGTMQYLSPEQVQRRYNHKSDIWGIGCLVYAMCTARISNEKARVMFRDRNKPSFEAEMATDLGAYSPVLLEFMLKLLARNASDRPTAAQALEECEAQLPPRQEE